MMAARRRWYALGIALVILFAAAASAGQATKTATATKAFEVIAVDGNQLVVKLPEGTRELTVPAGFTFDVDGKALSVGDLKPGMKGTATVTTKTTSTPVTVTEVRKVRVVRASPTSVLVQNDKGYRMWSAGEVEKQGIKIFMNGKPVEMGSLHEGDILTATIITKKPPKVMTEKQVQLAMAGGGAAAPAAAPAIAHKPAAKAAVAAEPAAAPAPKKLPKTASPVPLIGLLGLLFSGASFGVRWCRR